MILLDVNVLIYAHRSETADHLAYLDWLEEELSAPAPYGISDLVLSGFMRVVTHPQVFDAIESGSEWITTDRDYSRFPGLKWRHPLKSD